MLLFGCLAGLPVVVSRPSKSVLLRCVLQARLIWATSTRVRIIPYAMIRVQVSAPFPAAMIDRVNDPWPLPCPLGLGFLQVGLDSSGTDVGFLGFFLVQTGRALFGLLRSRRYVRWLVGGTSLTRKSADQRKRYWRPLGAHEVR